MKRYLSCLESIVISDLQKLKEYDKYVEQKSANLKSPDELFFKTKLLLKFFLKQLTSYSLKFDFLFHFDTENYSIQCLFFWCLLNGRFELAKFFWKYVDVRKLKNSI